MLRVWLVVAALSGRIASGGAPTYTEANLVNGANFAPGPLAPNSLATLFGKDLSWSTEGITAETTRQNALPDSLADVRVYVANLTAPLIYVSPTQINFLIPGNLKTGKATVRVARQGVSGPEVPVMLVDAEPQLFQSDGYAIAQHGKDNARITREAPAQAGETVVFYGTGFGRTEPNPAPGEIPKYPGLLTRFGDLKVYLAGSAVSSDRVFYAGLTPGSAGLYQINVVLPNVLDTDPEIRVSIGDQMSQEGLKLATGVPPTATLSDVAALNR
jgi:uncharacterized protein (TIGR03437 family)